MVSRVLVTTALEQTWPERKPTLFLGEWCRLYERRSRWSQLDAEVLPYHWDDRRKLEADFQYLSELYERLLDDLTEALNSLHNVEHETRYWRILLGPWLGYFLQMAYDRWASVHQAVSERDLSGTIVLVGTEDQFVPKDMGEFYALFHGDDWNHHIYSSILRHYPQVARIEVARQPRAERVEERGPSQPWLRRLASAAVSRASRSVSRERDVFMIRTSLPLSLELELNVRLGQFPQRWRAVPSPEVALDRRWRAWQLASGMAERSHDGPAERPAPFETIVRGLIVDNMPTVYLEGYAALAAHSHRLPWPKRPKAIWTSSSHHQDELFKAWAARHVENGVPLVIGQHGGHFGIGRWSFVEDHEIAIADRYLSWGWHHNRANNVVPVGQLKAQYPLRVDHGVQRHALLVTCGLPRYSYWMYSIPVAGQFLEYLDDQISFIEALPVKIRNKLIVRLHANANDWNQSARLKDRLPAVQYDEGRSSLRHLIRQSRLYIATYNATSFLESFSMNVPTVMFWNPRHWELRPSAVDDFEALTSVGIYHENAESAARHVERVWDDVGTWWNSVEVRRVVRDFTSRYSNLSGNLLAKLATQLRDAATDAAIQHTTRTSPEP